MYIKQETWIWENWILSENRKRAIAKHWLAGAAGWSSIIYCTGFTKGQGEDWRLASCTRLGALASFWGRKLGFCLFETHSWPGPLCLGCRGSFALFCPQSAGRNGQNGVWFNSGFRAGSGFTPNLPSQACPRGSFPILCVVSSEILSPQMLTEMYSSGFLSLLLPKYEYCKCSCNKYYWEGFTEGCKYSSAFNDLHLNPENWLMTPHCFSLPLIITCIKCRRIKYLGFSLVQSRLCCLHLEISPWLAGNSTLCIT